MAGMASNRQITWKKIITAMDATFAVAKRKPEKIQACTRFQPLTTAIPMQRSTNWANKQTGSRSMNWFVKLLTEYQRRWRRGLLFGSGDFGEMAEMEIHRQIVNNVSNEMPKDPFWNWRFWRKWQKWRLIAKFSTTYQIRWQMVPFWRWRFWRKLQKRQTIAKLLII